MALGSSAGEWLKYGCLGCLGILGLAVLGVAIVVGTAYLRVRSETVERRDLTREIPEPRPPAQPAPEDTRSSLPAPTSLEGVEAGRVVLDLSRADVTLEPGPPGEPIRVEAEYDTRSFELEERYEPAGETGWTYRLALRPKGTGAFLLLTSLFGGSTPQIRLLLPPHAPFSLEGRIRRGETTADLGGLWIVSVDLDLSQGAHRLSFAEPLAAPMGRFAVRGGQGALELMSLGNASPSEVNVTHSMGALVLDLEGPWSRDATIDARCSMGGFVIRVPRGVKIEGLDDVHVPMGEADLRALEGRPEPPAGAPTLRFSVSASMGGLAVEG
jgi:hypothetical protein